MNGETGGDSELQSCLLHYFEEESIRLTEIVPIKENLLLIKTVGGNTLIAKKYTTYSRLLLQMEFLQRLKKAGFENTYSFVEDLAPVTCNGYYIGFLEYIPTHKVRFHFHTVKQRREGIELLRQFHEKTSEIVGDLVNPIDSFEQTKKWEARWVEFVRYSNRFQSIIPKEILTEYIKMGDWALQGLIKYESEPKGQVVIVHGDVAHHNFLRRLDEKIYLIDFDLIAEAPAIIDYLQFANRILLYNNHSLADILSLPAMERYRNHRYFLYGLAFPTDIYREWNRLYRDNCWSSVDRVQALWKVTVEKYPQRLHYFQEVKKRISES